MRGHARLVTVHPEVTHIWHSEMNCCLHLPVPPIMEYRKLPAADAAARPIVTIEEAVDAIDELGGLERVKQLLSAMKEGRAAVERLGGMENTEVLLGCVEAMKNL